jgi:hypothetical protein
LNADHGEPRFSLAAKDVQQARSVH